MHHTLRTNQKDLHMLKTNNTQKRKTPLTASASRGSNGDFDTMFSLKANCAMQIYTTDRPQNSLRSLSESILSRSYARANASKNGQSATIRWDCNRDPLATPYDHSARKIAQHHAQLANKVSLAASILVRG